MVRQKIMNLGEFLVNYELTKKVADQFKEMLNFIIDVDIPQRKNIDLGKIISRVVSANLVADMEINGFRQDLVRNSTETIKHEISMLVSSYKYQTNVTPIEEYKDSGSWLDFC